MSSQHEHRTLPCKRRFFPKVACLSAGLLVGAAVCGISDAANVIVNGSFEDPDYGTSAGFAQDLQTSIPGWNTTAGDGKIEVWHDGFGFLSADGDQHAEINATQVGELFQTVSGIPSGASIGYSFQHRGRSGIDTLELTIVDLGVGGLPGGGDDTQLLSKQFSASTGAWATHSGAIAGLTPGNAIRFGFKSIPRVGQGIADGNLLDNVQFGVGVGVPEPSTAAIAGVSLLGVCWSSRCRQA